MGGVAGLVVAPDARGRGVSLRLVTALAQRSLEPDDPVSALPGHHPDVRALGWEVAGAQHRISTRAEAFRMFGCKDVSLPAATDSDVEPFRYTLHDRYAAPRKTVLGWPVSLAHRQRISHVNRMTPARPTKPARASVVRGEASLDGGCSQ